jgi:hypothetical protein
MATPTKKKRKEIAERALLLIQGQADAFGKPSLRIKAFLEEIITEHLAELEANTDDLVYCITQLLEAHALDELQKPADAEK